MFVVCLIVVVLEFASGVFAVVGFTVDCLVKDWCWLCIVTFG